MNSLSETNAVNPAVRQMMTGKLVLERVSVDEVAWGEYEPLSFEAHAGIYRGEPGKLRFLQSVNQASRPTWGARKDEGAILL